jgi:hypothetical protein
MRKLLVVAIASCQAEPPPAEPVIPGAVCEIDPWDRTGAQQWSASGYWLWLRERLAPFAIPELRTKVVEAVATPHPVTTAVHAAAISVIAAPEDGAFAVTADSLGDLRLWPTLDGKREPVVVVAHPPAALAVARAGHEIAIAGLDVVGRLEIVRTTPVGEPRGRAVVDSPRPYRLVRQLPAGFLAVRDDQTIDRIDAQGAIVASLVPEPGSSIGAIAARRGKAIALVASADGMSGRWLDLAGGIAWGKTTPKLPLEPGPAALSPDGRHLMGVYARLHTAAIVDLVTARTFALPWEREDFKEPMMPLGFTEPNVLAMTSTFGGGVMWSRDKTTTRGFFGFEPSAGPSVAVDGGAISGAHEMLALSTPVDTKYLGYREVRLRRVQGTRDGWLASPEGRAPIFVLDAKFHERRRIDAPADAHNLLFVDERHAIAMLDVDRGRARNLYSLDLANPEANELAWQTTGYGVRYEPSTHLVAVSEDEVIQLARLDPKTGVIGAPSPIAMAGRANQHQVYLLDPARNHRNVAVALDIDYASRVLTVSEIRATADGFAIARDYNLDASKAGVYEKVLRDYNLSSEGNPLWRASPDGKWDAKADGARITLRDRSGHVKWVADAHGATEVAWRPNGELAIIGGGMATIDLATGALRDRQCGWDFGLANEPTQERQLGSLCEAP